MTKDKLARGLALQALGRKWNDDKYKLVYGVEYLSSFHKKIMAGTSTKIVFSGDSTTAGDGTSGATFHMETIAADLITKAGFTNITTVNKGRSGKAALHWEQTYVTEDLSENPDVLIVRWGINDPYYKNDGTAAPTGVAGDSVRRTAADFISSIRNGLATVRASRSLDSLAIVLVAPSSTSNTNHRRDQKWHESINTLLKQAARDYQCTFIDLYSFAKDSVNASDWMDDPYGTGEHIHPRDVGNLWFSSIIFDTLFPTAVRYKYGKVGFNLETATAAALSNSWVNFGAGFTNAQYYKDSAGIVRIEGMIKSGTGASGTVLFRMAAGYAPPTHHYFTCHSDTGPVPVQVYSGSGDVVLRGTSGTTWLSLSGINFKTT